IHFALVKIAAEMLAEIGRSGGIAEHFPRPRAIGAGVAAQQFRRQAGPFGAKPVRKDIERLAAEIAAGESRRWFGISGALRQEGTKLLNGVAGELAIARHL